MMQDTVDQGINTVRRPLFYLIVVNFCLLGLISGFLTGYFISQEPNESGHVDMRLWQPGKLQAAQTCTVSIAAAGVSIEGEMIDSAGSGVLIDRDGYILTNEHIIHGAKELSVTTYDQKTYPARVMGASVRDDLAVLKIDGETFPAMEPGYVDQLAAGMAVAALGNPLDTAADGRCVTTFGLISRLNQRLSSSIDTQNSRFYDNMIQTDAKTLPGNSGGPLIDTEGQLIGINTALGIGAETGRQFGFAILMDGHTLELVKKLKRGETIDHALLGIQPVAITQKAAQMMGLNDLSGALVASVLPHTPAWESGIQNGDIIRQIDNKPIHSPEELLSVLHRYEPEQSIKLELLRNINSKPAQITIFVKLICRKVLLTADRKNYKHFDSRHHENHDF